MSGVRVYNQRLLDLGLTLPGFVERSKVIASLPSLGLLTIAAYTPENWKIEYLEIDEISEYKIEKIIEDKPDLIAISSLTARITDAYNLSSKFRKAGLKVAIGGLHASALPDEAMKFADTVIQGEGEIIWQDLIKDFENQELKPLYSSKANRKFNFQFSDFKMPRYDLLDISKYNRLTIQTTRGCPLDCIFCGASRMISTYKKKPILQVEKELNKILEIWENPFIELADDNTFVDKSWSIELLTLFNKYRIKWFTETDISIAENKKILELLSSSNCAQLLIGLESSAPESLLGIDKNNWKFKQFDTYRKKIDTIQSFGISVNGCFILGFDSDTEESFKNTDDFIKSTNLTEVQLTMLTPFPGTYLYDKFQQEGRLLEDNNWSKFTLFDLTFKPKNMSVAEFEFAFENLMQSTYTSSELSKRRNTFKTVIKNR